MKKHLTILIFPIILLIIFVGIFSYIIFAIDVNSTKISELEREQNSRLIAKDNTKNLEDSILKANEELTPSEKIWLTETEVPTFLSSVESLGEEVGTEITIVNITDNSSGGAGLSLILSIEGDFDAVFRTMRLLENLPYASSFSRIALSLDEESLEWQADVEFSVLSFKKE